MRDPRQLAIGTMTPAPPTVATSRTTGSGRRNGETALPVAQPPWLDGGTIPLRRKYVTMLP